MWMQKNYEDGWLFHNHAWHLLHEIIKLIPKDVNNMLDFGGGTGLATAVIKAVCPYISATVADISEENINFWNKRKLNGVVFGGKTLPFKNNSFDLVISSHVIEHSEIPEILISEMSRVCSDKIIIAVPDGDTHFFDHKIVFDRKNFIEKINEGIGKEKEIKSCFPVYHPHINNLVAVIGKK